jgi:indole-3-glycerol phosphate synthase
MNMLDEIVAHKRTEVAAAKQKTSVDALRQRAEALPRPPDFLSALRSGRMGLIAEVKRRSPSAGVIREPFDPTAIVRAYAGAGAQAISVLMDRKYFGGGEADFQAVRGAVLLPLLYKEFVLDEWQIWHAAALGASAALLIVATLSRSELEHLLRVCFEARVAVLTEVHDEAEMEVAVGCGATCIGINNRDLKSFAVDLETTFRLMNLAPPSSLLVSESGIRSVEDVVRLKEAGVQAVLVGEHLLRQRDPGQAVQELMGVAWARS